MILLILIQYCVNNIKKVDLKTRLKAKSGELFKLNTSHNMHYVNIKRQVEGN
jgi:hypothetical protein